MQIGQLEMGVGVDEGWQDGDGTKGTKVRRCEGARVWPLAHRGDAAASTVTTPLRIGGPAIGSTQSALYVSMRFKTPIQPTTARDFT